MLPMTRRVRFVRKAAVLALGSALILNGCDPTLRTTTENGIISASTAALGSFLQALVAVAGDAINRNLNSNANTNTNG